MQIQVEQRDRTSAGAWGVCAAAALWGAWVLAHALTRASPWHAPLLDHSIADVAFWREAAWRALRAWSGAGLVVIAAWQLGAWLTAPCRAIFDASGERFQFVLAAGTVALSSLFLVCASVGLYRPGVIATLVVLAAISRPREGLDDLQLASASVRSWARAQTLRSSSPIYLACAGAALTFALVHALAPEVEYDALWYHLWLPREWLTTGRLTDIVSEYIGLYPGGWELLNGAAMTIGGTVAAKLLHFACLPLLAGAACLLARTTGVPLSTSVVVAICISAPTMMWEASTAYVDLALAWLTTLSSVALFRYHDTRDRRWVILAAALAGGALTVKHTGLVALAVQATLLALTFRPRRETVSASVRRSAILLVLAIGLAFPWYARAYAASGNPVFPEMYGVFDAMPPERWSHEAQAGLERFQEHFGMGRGVRAMLLLPWNLTVHAAHFGGTFGAALLVLAPFAIATRSRRVAVTVVGVAAYVAVWASPLGSFQLRFLTPTIPFAAVWAAAGLRQIEKAARSLARPLTIAVHAATVVLLVLNLPPFVDWLERDRRGWDWWLTHVLPAAPLAVAVGAESEQEYLARRVPSYRAWQEIDRRTPPDARVLTFFGGDHLYSHRARVWSDSALARTATWASSVGDERAMLAALRRLGITHVLFDRRQLEGPLGAQLAIAGDAARRCCLVPFYVDDRAEVFAVRSSNDAIGRQ